MRANKSSIDLNINPGSCWVANASDPEALTGYEEDFVRAVYDKYNLEINQAMPKFETMLKMGPSASSPRRVGALQRNSLSQTNESLPRRALR